MNQSWKPQPAMVEALDVVGRELGVLYGPAEDAFLAIGSALGDASGQLGRIRTCFASLLNCLDGAGAAEVANRLREATARISSLAGEANGSGKVLDRLGNEVTKIDGCLEDMVRIIREVGALAINAKIQASFVQSSEIDFSVFTAEIQNLAILAGQTLGQTRARLRALGRTVAMALAEEQGLEQSSATELARVQGRLAEGMTILVEQHHAAAIALERVGLVSDSMAHRVSGCITELQFNDTASQRIGHVRDALTILVELIRSGEEDDVDALVGAVSRLQALQLSRTGEDYGERVEALRSNLRGIGHDVQKILADADQAIGGGHPGDGQKPFLTLLQDDIALAVRLLHDQAVGRQDVKGIMQSVSLGFAEMTAELEALRSIDFNMRMMSLNATFKCARLGDHGLALGIIANELQLSSGRMQVLSIQIARLLETAIERSKGLGIQENGDLDQISEIEGSMRQSLSGLGDLSRTLDASLRDLHCDGDLVAGLLAKTADNATIHHRIGNALTKSAQILSEVADGTGVDNADITAMGDRIRTLLAGHYTMQSERLIHQIFADCFGDEPVVTATKVSAAETNIDDFLF